MAKDNYKELVAQAEKAVSAVTDPSLKQIAFQKVLDDLLKSERDDGTSIIPTPSVRRSKRRKRLRGTARGGPTQYIQELIGDGFFEKPKLISQVKAELGNRGHHIPITALSVPLLRLCKARVLRRQKTNEKNTYAYSVW